MNKGGIDMKIMISQPMRGRTDEEIRIERESLVKELEAQGHEVVDTVFDDFPNGQDTPVHYLAKSIEFIANVDGVVFIKGWESARGCKIEYEVAKNYGKFIMEI